MGIEGLSLIAVAVAFAGGVVSFVSPCVLPLVPIYLGHLSGVTVHDGKIEGTRTTFFHSLGFVIGFSLIFIALGATIGLLGGTAGGQGDKIARGAGILLMLFGLYMAGVFKLPIIRRVLAPATGVLDRIYYQERRVHFAGGDRPSYWRSFGVGGAFAVGWTPCITPVLGAILTLAYTSTGNDAGAWSAAGQSALLLTFYTAGLSVPFLMAGLALGRVTPIFKKMNRLLPTINVVSGFLLVGVGYLVYQNIVTRLNEYFDFLPYVNIST